MLLLLPSNNASILTFSYINVRFSSLPERISMKLDLSVSKVLAKGVSAVRVWETGAGPNARLSLSVNVEK